MSESACADDLVRIPSCKPACPDDMRPHALYTGQLGVRSDRSDANRALDTSAARGLLYERLEHGKGHDTHCGRGVPPSVRTLDSAVPTGERRRFVPTNFVERVLTCFPTLSVKETFLSARERTAAIASAEVWTVQGGTLNSEMSAASLTTPHTSIGVLPLCAQADESNHHDSPDSPVTCATAEAPHSPPDVIQTAIDTASESLFVGWGTRSL